MKVQALEGVVDRYYAVAIHGLTPSREVVEKHGREITMPCGAVAAITEIADQPCPNSGNCSAGVKRECWALKVFP